MEKAEQYVMLFLFPQSLFYQSPPASSLIPHPARTGINHLREQHYRAEIASSLKMTKVYTCKHVHKTHTLACSPVSTFMPPCLLLTQTQPSPPAAHTQCVCMSSKRWVENYKLKVSAGEGRSCHRGFDMLLLQSVCGASDLPASVQ